MFWLGFHTWFNLLWFPPNHRPSLTLLVYSSCVTSQNAGQWASRMSSRDLMLPHFHQVMSSFWPQPKCAVWQGAEASTVCCLFSIFGPRPNEKKCKRINDLTGIIGSSTEHYKSERDLSALHSYSKCPLMLLYSNYIKIEAWAAEQSLSTYKQPLL